MFVRNENENLAFSAPSPGTAAAARGLWLHVAVVASICVVATGCGTSATTPANTGSLPGVDCVAQPLHPACQPIADVGSSGGTQTDTSGSSGSTSDAGTTDSSSGAGSSSGGASDASALEDTNADTGAAGCEKTDPPTEICDGKDNDCDGQTDNDTCDDGSDCTTDKCDPSKYDGKQQDSGCAYDFLAGDQCDDGNPCTEGEKCSIGVCGGGKVKTCDDNNSCTLDDCVGSTGECKNHYLGDGKFCNDGLSCTNNDACKAGKCEGVVTGTCNDGNPCTKDGCDDQGKCSHEEVANLPCNDGNPCTTDDKCQAIVGCVGTKQVICDDNNPCTTDTCAPSQGGCVGSKVPKGTQCNKDVCNKLGKCDENGQCTGFKMTCDDDNPCTNDTCDQKLGVCKNAPVAVGSICDDGDQCTNGEKCDSSAKCAPPAGQKGCKDDNPCTIDGCDQAGNCTYKPEKQGAVCNDGDGCTESTFCAEGQCVVGASPKVLTIAGKSKPGWVDGAAGDAAFNYPRALALAPNGDVFVADRDNNRIRHFNKAANTVKTLAGSGVKGFADGPAAAAKFQSPQGIVIDASGTLFVSDRGNHRIRKIDPNANNKVTTLAGSGGQLWKDGKGKAASFAFPEGMALDKNGNLYVADSYNQRIRKISMDGTTTTVAGQSSQGTTDGPVSQAKFYRPHGVALLGQQLFVADSYNNRIRRIDLTTQTVSTIAGDKSGFADGKGAAAKFWTPTDIVVDVKGALFVSDRSNNRLRRVTVDGIVTTLAGTGNTGHADGAGSAAKFTHPWGLAIDKDANIYVADSTNHRIRKVNAPYKVCNDNSPCTTDSCDKITGDCIYKKQVVGTNCDDGSACTAKDACDAAGKCTGYKKPCFDGNNCTDDGCNPVTGACQFKPNSNKCNDDDACTQGDTCLGGTCKAGAGNVSTIAGNGNSSTTDAADATKGSFNKPSAVTADAAGNIFVSSPSANVIRRFTIGGKLETFAGVGVAGFADGEGSKAKFKEPWGLAPADKGAIWVADSGNHRIRRIAKDGKVSSFVGSGAAAWADGNGTKASFNTPRGVAADAFGGLFVADTNNNRIRKVGSDGKVTTLAGTYIPGLADGKGAAARFNEPTGVTVGTDGSVYVADAKNNAIRRIKADGSVLTLAGKPAFGYKDGTGANAQFNKPTGIAMDSSGNLLVVDSLNNSIRRVTQAGVVATVAGSSFNGFADGEPKAARFTQPLGIAVDKLGRIFIADRNNGRVRLMAPATTVCKDDKLCTKDSCNKKTGKCSYVAIGSGGICDDGNPCTVSELCDDKGNCAGKKKDCNDSNSCTQDACSPYSGGCQHQYIEGFCDDGNPCTTTDLCVKGKCQGDVGIVETVAGSTNGFSDGAATKARFYRPRGMDGDMQGNVYVADYQNQRIRRITPQGQVTTWAGNGGIGLTNGTGTGARFYYPTDVAVDATGMVYVADRSNRCIRRIDPSRQVTTFAGTNSSGFADGPGTSARFNYPEGIASDRVGYLYVADTNNHRIRKIDSNGYVTTIAGSSYGYKDGKGTQAWFRYPRSIGVDKKGYVWVGDYSNYRIRRIAPNGTVTTVAGNGLGGYGNKYADGKGSSASFGWLWSLAVTPAGDALIVDRDAHVVRRITPQGVVTTWAGVRGKAGSKDGVANEAQFNYPWGIGVTMAGHIYVGEYNTGRIRKITNPTKVCDDGNECTTEACDAKTGNCKATPVADGTKCTDGKLCLANRICNVGKCVGGVPKTCDDKNTCTIDSCDNNTGSCVYKPAPGCVGYRTVFVSSSLYSGNLGYLSGADAKCQSLANQKGLKGTFKAWLGGRSKTGSYQGPSQRFNKGSVSYRLVNGTVIANNFNDLVDGNIKAPISVDQNGTTVKKHTIYPTCNNAISGSKVWTNTRTNGSYYTSFSRYHCNYFTTSTSSSSYRAAIGDSGSSSSKWTYACTSARCNYSGRIYCFAQSDNWTKN